MGVIFGQLKPGGAIPEKGKKITLSVKNIADLSRDVIKVCFFTSVCFHSEPLVYSCITHLMVNIGVDNLMDHYVG